MTYKQAQDASHALIKRGIMKPEYGIVLGTGLGDLVNHIKVEIEIGYENIPHFPISTVESHSGKLIYGKIGSTKVLVMQGRFHFYEGYTMQQVTFPIRVMKLLGIKALLLSNACGSMNPKFKKGSLMMIEDHINMLPDNPLSGKNVDEMGPRFTDMSEPYSLELNKRLTTIAKREKIKLHKGIYVAVQGPNVETKAEYRYLRMIGADVVGMSTVPEVLVANHCGLPCAAISVITDDCDPDHLKKIDIVDIIETAGKAQVGMSKLIVALVGGEPLH